MVTRIVLILLTVLVATSGCGGEGRSEAAGDDRTRVVAAFYPLAFAAEQIGGDVVEVTNLTPPGAEPHDVELSARDVERVHDADLVLYLGGGFQPALERIARARGDAALDLLEGLRLREAGDAHGHGGGDTDGIDPHAWLDPLLFARMAERIGERLDAEVRARELVRELEALHGELERGLADCERREIVTSHAAFGYLADRYGLEQVAITGLSPDAEPSARDLERVIEEVREHGATTIFFETLVSPRLAETVARETGATTAVLDPLEGLTADAEARGDDYFGVMRANLAALREALGCR